MNIYKVLILIAVVMLISCCDDPPKYGECNDDACFDLSDLDTETDYYLPFKLYNDLKTEFEEIRLNGKEIDFVYGQTYEFANSGFYQLVLLDEDSDRKSKTLLFTLGTAERENAEWGIEAWVPKAFETGPLDAAEIKSIYPRHCYPGIGLPFIFYALKDGTTIEGYSLANSSTSGDDFYIKHGVGSVMLNEQDLDGNHDFTIDDQSVQLLITELSGPPMILSGELSADLSIAENALVHITGNLNIPSDKTMTINAGALILIDEGVNINNEGPINIIGSEDNPVFITCSEQGKYWGGFISNGSAAIIEATNAIFCQSGYHDTGEYTGWGHAKRQALFYTANSKLRLSYCYMTDHIGQIFYPKSANLTLESILVQRVKTSGQLNYTTTEITNSIFTDFPDDSYDYKDDDNDGLYINYSNVTIDNCIFMFAKDDGIDSGGDQGGTVTVTNTLFEACFHEGTALSSKGEVVKNHTYQNCTFFNCGQGIELGFSGPQHTVTVENCKFLNNGVGIRYGDNYKWSSVQGQMYINNSQSLGNSRDVWNMVRHLWAPRLEQMHFNNVQVSAPVSQYPDLEVISN